MVTNQEIIFALPKGRIQNDVLPTINKLGIEIEPEFFDTKTRKLIFETNKQNLKVIQARSFDIASFVASGKADIGVCGLDVIEEFPNEQIIRIKTLISANAAYLLLAKNLINYLTLQPTSRLPQNIL